MKRSASPGVPLASSTGSGKFAHIWTKTELSITLPSVLQTCRAAAITYGENGEVKSLPYIRTPVRRIGPTKLLAVGNSLRLSSILRTSARQPQLQRYAQAFLTSVSSLNQLFTLSLSHTTMV